MVERVCRERRCDRWAAVKDPWRLHIIRGSTMVATKQKMILLSVGLAI